jgi:hypothetical protein
MNSTVTNVGTSVLANSPMKLRIPLSTLCVSVVAIALALALFVQSVRHSAELHAQLHAEFLRHNAQLAEETLQFHVRLTETAVQYAELAAEGACLDFDSSAKR